MNERILIVEPDVDLARTLAYVFECHGYRPQVVGQGLAAIAAARADPPHLVLGEYELPDLRGPDLCGTLRKSTECRNVLMVYVSARADEIDRVVAFEVGADDFVAKPFSVRELVLRVRALLRRVFVGPFDETELTDGPVRVSPDGHVTVAGQPALATPVEVAVLRVLMQQPERVFNRRELVLRAWGRAERVQERTVDCAVKRLRRKLGPAGDLLETVRGVGFRWRRHFEADESAPGVEPQHTRARRGMSTRGRETR
jgi:two-component system phosphate regulon response regulator PhoB